MLCVRVGEWDEAARPAVCARGYVGLGNSPCCKVARPHTSPPSQCRAAPGRRGRRTRRCRGVPRSSPGPAAACSQSLQAQPGRAAPQQLSQREPRTANGSHPNQSCCMHTTWFTAAAAAVLLNGARQTSLRERSIPNLNLAACAQPRHCPHPTGLPQPTARLLGCTGPPPTHPTHP